MSDEYGGAYGGGSTIPELETFVARRHEPPDTLPTKDDTRAEDISLFGRTNFSSGFSSTRYIFGLKRRDRMRHMYVIGKSGVGKTKMLEHFIRADIHFEHGLGVIDPHGDLIQDILDFLPEDRLDDVVLIDPSDRDFPISFNPIANVPEEDKHMITDGIIEIFKKQFSSDWTPRIEHLLRFSTLAMIDYPKGTLNGMVSLLSSGPYRGKVIEHVKDPVVRRFWAIEFPEWSQRYDAEAVSPLLNKLGQLLADPLMRNIFGQQDNKIDFFDVMQNEKIFLVNLSKGRIGDEKSAFFGAVIITKIYQAAMQRIRLPSNERTPFYFYVDEFQNIATKTFENILAEARKFAIALCVANQNLSQLTPSLRSTLFGNVANIIVFQIGAEDAAIMEREMSPIFGVSDMINLAEREIYVKMTIDGKRWDPFSADVLTVTAPKHPSYAVKIIDQVRDSYARPKDEVEKEVTDSGEEKVEKIDESQVIV